MNELRLYLRRDSLQDGTDCAWVLLDDAGAVEQNGRHLEHLPRVKRCHLVLASDLVLTVGAQLPDLPERRLAPLLPMAAEAATMVDADNIHAVLLQRDADGKAILGVVEQVWLEKMLARLAELGLYPDSALPEYLLLPHAEDCWSVSLRAGEIMVRFSRHEGMALDEGEPPVGLILALSQRGQPRAVRVYEAGQVATPDWSRWQSALNTAVQPAGAWDWQTAPWPDLPDLMQGRFAPGRGRLDWARLARGAAWGLAMLAGIQLAGTAVDWALLVREQAAIKQEMRSLAEKSLPAHAALVDPAWQVSERLKVLRAAAGKPTANSLFGMLDRLGQVWPVAGGPAIKTLVFESGTLSVSLAEADAAWLEQLRTAAAARGLQVTVDEDKAKGVSLGIRPSGMGDGDGQ